MIVRLWNKLIKTQNDLRKEFCQHAVEQHTIRVQERPHPLEVCVLGVGVLQLPWGDAVILAKVESGFQAQLQQLSMQGVKEVSLGLLWGVVDQDCEVAGLSLVVHAQPDVVWTHESHLKQMQDQLKCMCICASIVSFPPSFHPLIFHWLYPRVTGRKHYFSVLS